MSDDQDQKTEEPTGKRLEQARESGQLAISRETAMWVALLGVLLVFKLAVPPMASGLATSLRVFIENPHQFALDDVSVQTLFLHVLTETARISGIAFLVFMGSIVLGYMIQTGFFYSFDLLAPDFSRLSPARGLKRLFSVNALADLVKSLGKLFFLGLMAYVALKPVMMESPQFTGFSSVHIMEFLHREVVYIIAMLLLVLTAIAIADFFFARFQYFRSLRMSKTEIKDEFKQQEGDPMIKGRLRQLRIEKARKRMMAQVPKADVVITNPSHYAVALQYDQLKMAAPTVVAKGINLIAERIKEIAEENRVPMVSNPTLARALYATVEVDDQIPTEHYRAVAEIISYVYKLKKKK